MLYTRNLTERLTITQLSKAQLQKAQLLFQQNRYKEAEILLRGLLTEQPENPHVLYALAQIALKFNSLNDAITLLEKCVPLMPEHSEPLLQLTELYQLDHQLNDAERCFQKLLSSFPNLCKAHFLYAGFLKSMGNKEESEAELRNTLKLDPKHSAAMLALSEMVIINKGDALLIQMEQLLKELTANGKSNEISKMHLHYALGKGADDQGEYQQAFDHWAKANSIQLSRCNFRVSQMLPFYDQLKLVFDSEIRVAGSFDSDEITPIFIVGMPRSGTTLLEQMLSSHSEIESAGEVNYIGGNVVTQIQQITGKPYPLGLELLNKEQIKMLGASYLSQLQKHHSKARYIIDKLPANFQSIGLIKMILPHAIIINLSRNPLAISLSIYRNYFAENEPYFCDLSEFSEYYLAYRDLIQYWYKTLPGQLTTVTYEELVLTPKTKIEQILECCNLSWQNACLEYYQNPKQVLTLSAAQVQQPLYKTSLDNWKKYKPFLSDIENKLK